MMSKKLSGPGASLTPILSNLSDDEARWISFADHTVAIRMRWITNELFVDPASAELASEFASLTAQMRELRSGDRAGRPLVRGLLCTDDAAQALAHLQDVQGIVAFEQGGAWAVILPLPVHLWLTRAADGASVPSGVTRLARGCAEFAQVITEVRRGQGMFIDCLQRVFSVLPVAEFARLASALHEHTVAAANPEGPADEEQVALQTFITLFPDATVQTRGVE